MSVPDRSVAIWRLLQVVWGAVFIGTVVVAFVVPRWTGIAGGSLGGTAMVIGLTLATNVAGVARASVEQARRSRWVAPALAGMTATRLFGLAVAGIGASFVVVASTGHFR